MPLDDLFAEAERQLNVCNACRYCEGYCPVWPALELRTDLTPGDMTHLANLCHDCRDCFTACMYTAPHEFALNPPQLFTRLREDTYRRYVWPRSAPRWMRGRRGVVVWFVAVAALLVVLSVLTNNGAVFAGPGSGSAYALIPHLLLVAVVTVPVLWTIGVLCAGVARYWKDTHGRLGDLVHPLRWAAALGQGLQLRHMRGGGAGCDYPGDAPASGRRYFHLATSYGFLLCFVSTTSAWVMQQFLGLLPPYGYLSVPVVTGTAGGLGMLAGCAGLLALKGRSDRTQSTEPMLRADHGFLWALLILSATGLLTLVLRTGPLFGPLLVVHLAAVVVAFGVAPYTKFVHWIYRLLALYKDGLDRSRADGA